MMRVKYSLSRIIYDLLVLHDEDNNEQRFSKLRKGSRPDFLVAFKYLRALVVEVELLSRERSKTP